MPIRIGVQIQPQQADFAQMQEAWRAVEELGADSIYTWDHFYPLYGDPDGKHFEGATSLAALAAGPARTRPRPRGRTLPLIEERRTKLNPPPVGEIPIMIGGAGEKVTLKLVA